MANVDKIIIAEDHPLFRGALRQAVEQAFPGIQIIEAEDFAAVQVCAEKHADADMILLDLSMPGAHGFSSLVFLRGHHPSLPVVVVSAFEDADIIKRAIDLGASGFVPKSAPLAAVAEALNHILAGELWLPKFNVETASTESHALEEIANRIGSLTRQQFRVLLMLMEGLLNKQIAFELNVSEATVKAHVTAILRKLQVNNRTQAVVAVQALELDDKAQASFLNA